jgi:nicotinate-nucleotide adenylyltransferase
VQPSSGMRRMALFGGSFNPPHLGHQLAMLHVLSTARVDGLLAVPCVRHPFDKPLAPFAHRIAMLRLACAPLQGVIVSDVEQRLNESRTLLTVKALLEEYPGTRLILAMGEDLVAERQRWYGWPELERLVEFFVIGRNGFAANAPGATAVRLPAVSSSEVRERLARGDSVEGLLPAAVIDYIRQHGLYGGT